MFGVGNFALAASSCYLCHVLGEEQEAEPRLGVWTLLLGRSLEVVVLKDAFGDQRMESFAHHFGWGVESGDWGTAGGPEVCWVVLWELAEFKLHDGDG